MPVLAPGHLQCLEYRVRSDGANPGGLALSTSTGDRTRSASPGGSAHPNCHMDLTHIARHRDPANTKTNVLKTILIKLNQ